MIKKRAIIISVILASLALLHLLTLGVTFSRYVRAYCKSDGPNAQPAIYVLMEPVYTTAGIRWLCSSYSDQTPYPLEVLVNADDRLDGDGTVIESLEVVFSDGTTNVVIRPDGPRGGPFAEYTPVASDRVPGRSFRAARIGIPGAIWQRGSFAIRIRGYIYGRQKQPFVRNLRMEYKREFNVYTGWKLLAGMSC
jgi:hypothetical protein